MTELVHFSSIVVTADPVRLKHTKPAIQAHPIADIALSDPTGKLVVTLETTNESKMVQALTDIQLIPGVVSAALVYHQTEDFSDNPKTKQMAHKKP